MKINGTEYAGTLTHDDAMHIDLELEDATGLTVGLDVEIEDGNTIYFERCIITIEGNHVECDAAQATTEDYENSLRKLGMTI